MLTKKTSEKVLGLMTAGGDHDARAVVSVARDVASRGWIIYFVDDRGRLNHCRTMDSVQEDGARATILNVAVDECTAGGIDPAALLATDDRTEGEQIAESTRRETTTTTVADLMNGSFVRTLYLPNETASSFTLGPGFGDSPEPEGAQRMMVGYDPGFSHMADAIVYFPPRAGKTAALRQSAAMQAMASVMGQAGRVAQERWDEDNAWYIRMSISDRTGPMRDMLRDGQTTIEAALHPGWRDRAASRWSAQVRAKLAEREEAKRPRVWVQTEEG